MLSLDKLEFTYEPYPIGVARGVFDDDMYRQMAESFPARDLFEYKEVLGHKYSLSEVNNPQQYRAFIQSHKIWRSLHDWIKRDEFPYEVFDTLSKHNIELAVPRPPAARPGSLHQFYNKLRRGRKASSFSQLNTRFEFSMLPADGGCIKPHTDHPSKIVTLVVSMAREGEWDSSFGGGTEVMKPRDVSRNYNFLNYQMHFDEVESLRTFAYQPNQCVVFIKTFNSLHGVRPMTGFGTSLMRKTLTINIEQLS